ncbi:MAG: DEAD/DEAH box helicase family protein [Mariniblastus sp.]|nr:DEAD/DEAH box helicase family protein [Mariniblastus sp.]
MNFPDIKFRGELRPSQQEVLAVAQQHVRDQQKKLYINAPPGSGKTVTGLYLWAQLYRCPAVVLSPNSAIQSQWLARTDLFELEGKPIPESDLSADPKAPALLTSLTYQALTMPARGQDNLADQAIQLWKDTLLNKGKASSQAEAAVWIEDIQQHNSDYFQERLAYYSKKIREEITRGNDALSVLHASSLENLNHLRACGVRLVILDECHHLVGHWGRILNAIDEFLDRPVVLGLTATPPDPEEADFQDWEIYESLLGRIDYDVPVPAVVKDGFLSPYKDLCYFVRPSEDELDFISNTSRHMEELLDQLQHVPEGEDRIALNDWVYETLEKMELPLKKRRARSWGEYEKRFPAFSRAARILLKKYDRPLPAEVRDVPQEQIDESEDLLAYCIPVIDPYVRLYLMRTQNAACLALAERVKKHLRLLGAQITETGNQKCASPVNRVLAYSKSKARALLPILKREQELLADTIRAVVVCDYEKTSAVEPEVSHVLDDEAGGAVAAFRTLLEDEVTDRLNPVLVTGSTVLVDDDLCLVFHQFAADWLQQNDCEVELAWKSQHGYQLLKAKGPDWVPRVYIELVTEFFQAGFTKCLVGTRGLLGEGWDANKINVLVDLTSVTTSMSVNQLRGRSIRLDSDVPRKIANNWDVVCLAPEFLKGLTDYRRFCKKHSRIYGVTDDGKIEKGVAHVHPAFTEIKPRGVERVASVISEEMLDRAGERPKNYELWGIGQPFQGIADKSVSIGLGRSDPQGLGFPPFSTDTTGWTAESLTQKISEVIVIALRDAGLIEWGASAVLLKHLYVGEQAGGYVRVFLEQAGEEERNLFTEALSEVFSPALHARYVIERFVDMREFSIRTRHPWFATFLPSLFKKYFTEQYEHIDSQRDLVMLHAVPSALAKNREQAEIFKKYWNRMVSPGELIYTQRGEGHDFLLEAAEQGLLLPQNAETKEFFR